MDNLNIRVYKAVFPDGSYSFQCKTKDEFGVTSMSNMELLVGEVVDNIHFLSASCHDGKLGNISIDFRPYHDIECSGAKPRLCMPLTEGKIKTFWGIFITK
ncbi:MAG: hypothetical protein ABIJ82_03940 [Patescibacteria group bacterium]|nr:hypothetical protein [Patescibacteria group bacterium]